MTRVLAATATVLAAAAVGLASYAAFKDDGSKTVVQQVTVEDGTPTSTTTGVSAVTNVYNKANKGVVEITVAQGFVQQDTAQGSGFVYDSLGHIITNEHVVEGGDSIRVRFWNGASHSATLVGTDTSTDLAVIKVDAPASLLHPIQLGRSSDVQVGQPVVAIGSPYGLEGTVTSGIVSALHREMTARNNFTIADSIQTDAPINHGNSGGPLLDLNGRVIGVNAQIMSSTSRDNSGIGFAIPSDTVRSVISQLVAGNPVEHAYLGVSLGSTIDGVQLNEIRPGTPAEKAGLEVDDILVTVDGREITDDPGVLTSVIDSKRPGEKITLTLTRNGDERTVTVTLGKRPS